MCEHHLACEYFLPPALPFHFPFVPPSNEVIRALSSELATTVHFLPSPTFSLVRSVVLIFPSIAGVCMFGFVSFVFIGSHPFVTPLFHVYLTHSQPVFSFVICILDDLPRSPLTSLTPQLSLVMNTTHRHLNMRSVFLSVLVFSFFFFVSFRLLSLAAVVQSSPR